MEEENKHKRGVRNKIRVTFPNGNIHCYKNITDTLIASLCEIGSDRFPEIKLEIGKLPILSKEIYPKFKKYMKPVCDGWYVNTQSDTDQKFLQLKIISDTLDLGLKIELGKDLESCTSPFRTKKSKSKDNLLVRFPDGEYVGESSSLDTYLQSLWKLGIDEIKCTGIEYGGIPVISGFQTSNNQIKVDKDRWATVPGSTKERAGTLRLIASMLKINLEISII